MTTVGRARDPAKLIWGVAGACWAGVATLLLAGDGKYASHDQIVEHSTLPWPVRIVLFTLVWAVMVAAMMLPTTVSMARLVTVVSARAPHPARLRSALAASYLIIWIGFGVVALAGDRGIHATVDAWPWLNAHSGLIKAGVLGLAGAGQFSGLKDRCLTACRDPISMLWQHYGRTARRAWRLGWAHALNCLGCCWALMLVMFGVGVGGLTWMLGLTAVMVTEKTTPWGRRLTAPVGVALLLAAGAFALGAFEVVPFANTLPTGLD